MRTLIILNNVIEKKDQITRTALGKLGFMAIECIEYDKSIPNLELFLKNYLNGKVICENLPAAWSLLK